jgi:hypothetical protein
LGGQALQQSTKAIDWDEEVVPALKRKLAEENQAFDQTTAMTMGVSDTRRPSGRTKPAPRQPHQYDEIIQDGLGSDELIPSEWATGSKARFLTASRQPARQASSRSVSDSYAQSGGWPDLETTGAADTSWSAGDRHRDDGHNEASEALAQKPSKVNILSGQALQELDGNRIANIGESGQKSQGHRSTASRTRTSSQGSTAMLTNGSPSRIPTLKTSGTGAPSQNEASPARSGTTTQRQQHQPQIRQRTVSTSSAKKPMPKWSNHTYNEVPVSQAVIDEFGPLGGTPTKGVPHTPDNSMLVDEFGMPRSTSNPWDEELLPTVKRRLAQQAMMSNGGSRLSGVEGLVDTWDKNGMPLSMRSITPRKSSIRDVSFDPTVAQNSRTEDKADEKAVEELLQQDQRGSPKQRSYDPSDYAASERMKRLTDQLDFGFQAESHQTARRSATDPSVEPMQMKPNSNANRNTDGTQPVQAGEQQRHERKQQQQRRHEQNMQQQHQERLQQQHHHHQPQTRHVSDRDDQAVKGGCKCTIM